MCYPNILIRGVLGVRVRILFAKYAAVAGFVSPDTAWTEALEHFPVILRKRGIPVEAALSLLFSLEEIVQPVEFETYGLFEQAARTRLANRDPDDWPVLATALALRGDLPEQLDALAVGQRRDQRQYVVIG